MHCWQPDATRADVFTRIKEAADSAMDGHLMSHGWNHTPQHAIEVFRNVFGGWEQMAVDRNWVLPVPTIKCTGQ